MFATTPLRLHPALVGRRIHHLHSCHVRWDSRASPLMQLQMGPFTMGFFPSLSKGNTALLIKSISTHATANGPLPWVFFFPAFQRATPHFRSRASPLMQPQMGLYHGLFLAFQRATPHFQSPYIYIYIIFLESLLRTHSVA